MTVTSRPADDRRLSAALIEDDEPAAVLTDPGEVPVELFDARPRASSSDRLS